MKRIKIQRYDKMGTTIDDKNRIVAAILRNKKRLDSGYVYKGRRWLIGPSVPAGAYFVKDLRKGPNSRSYIICKQKPFKDRKEIHDYRKKYQNWIWYHQVIKWEELTLNM